MADAEGTGQGDGGGELPSSSCRTPLSATAVPDCLIRTINILLRPVWDDSAREDTYHGLSLVEGGSLCVRGGARQ